MGLYSFRFLKAGMPYRIRAVQFTEDLDALDAARRVARRGGVEIWAEDRFVALIRKDDAAPAVNDRTGG